MNIHLLLSAALLPALAHAERRVDLGSLGAGPVVAISMPNIFGKRAPAYGLYEGVSLGAAQGASYEEALTSVGFYENHVTLTEIFQDGRKIKVRYAKEYLSRMAGPNVLPPDCVAVKQDLRSNLAAVILCPNASPSGPAGVDMEMILGEGMPMTLAVFFKPGTATPQRLRALYDEIRAKAGNPPVKSTAERMDENLAQGRQVLDVAQARERLRRGSPSERAGVMREAGTNLWIHPAADQAGRLELLRAGARDADVHVREAALSQFELGARVTGGAAIVIDALRTELSGKTYPPALGSAVEAAICLLYEAHNDARDSAALVAKYGSADLGVIKARSAGTVAPEDAQRLQRLVGKPAERTWTVAQQTALRGALEAAAVNPDVSPELLLKIHKALADYPLPR